MRLLSPANLQRSLGPSHSPTLRVTVSRLLKVQARFKLHMKELCVFNPRSLAGFGPHAKVRFCPPAAHEQTFKVKPDLTQHLLPTEDPLCTGQKAGLLIVAFKTPGYLAVAAYDPAPFLCLTLHADGVSSMPLSFTHPNHRDHAPASAGAFFQPSSQHQC